MSLNYFYNKKQINERIDHILAIPKVSAVYSFLGQRTGSSLAARLCQEPGAGSPLA